MVLPASDRERDPVCAAAAVQGGEGGVNEEGRHSPVWPEHFEEPLPTRGMRRSRSRKLRREHQACHLPQMHAGRQQRQRKGIRASRETPALRRDAARHKKTKAAMNETTQFLIIFGRCYSSNLVCVGI
jgi:hypothetical protein